MNKFIKELQRRNVFRVGGLYLGVAWVVIEVSSVILPEFDAPSWIFRSVVILAFSGFPVVLILSWLYEITEWGIERDEEVRDRPAASSGRMMDFVVIGVLVVALGISVFLNLTRAPGVAEPIPTLSVLIAKFDNRTEDPLFNGALEQALTIGLEGAPFITAFPREQAMHAAAKIRPEGGPADIDAGVAQLIAVREGIGGVLTGSVEAAGSGFRLKAQVTEPQTQQVLADADARASGKLDVLTAVGELADGLRRDLGDVTVGEKPELFTAASLEAAREYVLGQDLHLEGKDQEAIEHYRRAVELDPEFGRAYSGWALAEFRLGRVEESEQLWEKTLPLLDRMTERERFRTLGLYYLLVSRNYEKAVENYSELVERYPADSGGHNNLAVAHFFLRDFEAALQEGRMAVDIYPGKLIYRTNYALYAMYASDFDTAVAEATAVVAADPGYHKAYLPLAIAAIESQELTAARDAYGGMRRAGEKGASLAASGLADLAIYEGDLEGARTLLVDGIAQDEAQQNSQASMRKSIALAEVYFALGNQEQAAEVLDRVRKDLRNEAEIVPAAQLYIAMQRFEEATLLAAELANSLRPESRAYARVIEGKVAHARGDLAAALDSLRAALALSDLWIAHYELGLVYADAEHSAEALSEFQACYKRRGEAAAVFLDDVPTIRYSAKLSYWLGRSAEALGMKTDAVSSYQRFLASREHDAEDPLVRDASDRLQKL